MRVSVGTLNSAATPVYFDYAAPNITSIAPANGPTSGGIQVNAAFYQRCQGCRARCSVSRALRLLSLFLLACCFSFLVVLILHGLAWNASLSLTSYVLPFSLTLSLQVTLRGTDFGLTPTATVGGASCSSLTVLGHVQITCVRARLPHCPPTLPCRECFFRSRLDARARF